MECGTKILQRKYSKPWYRNIAGFTIFSLNIAVPQKKSPSACLYPNTNNVLYIYYDFNSIGLLLWYWDLSAQKISYIFQHIGTRTFKFALLFAVDCLATFCYNKFDIFVLQIGIYPTFTSENFNEIFGTFLIFKRSSVGVNLNLHIFWPESEPGNS